MRSATQAEAAAGVSRRGEFGRLGRPFDRRSPFYIGFVAALGVAAALALAYLVVAAGQILVLLGLAFFLAVGLDPAVRWLPSPRAAALGGRNSGPGGWRSAVFAGFLAAAIPVVGHPGD